MSPPVRKTGGDITDDLGRFRLFGLRAGTYYLAANQLDAQLIGAGSFGSYPLLGATLYPGGSSIAEAQPLTAVSGQELSGLSFALRPASTGTLTVAVSSDSGPMAVEFSYEHVGVTYPQTYRTAVDGRSVHPRRTAGTHTFFVREGHQVAFARVALKGDDLFVPLTLKRGGTLRGRLVMDGDASAALPPASIRVNARLLEPETDVRGTVTPDLSFELTGLIGPVQVTASATGGWVTRQLLVNGVDMTGLPLDGSRVIDDIQLVLTRQVVELSGTVRDATGRAAADAFVVLFADDAERRWPGSPYVRSVRADANGRFTVRNAPPGRYRAVAVEFLENGEESNPSLIAQLEAASTSVTLGHGVTPTLDLRLVPWP